MRKERRDELNKKREERRTKLSQENENKPVKPGVTPAPNYKELEGTAPIDTMAELVKELEAKGFTREQIKLALKK